MTTQQHLLRVLVVDDNKVNLSVLTRLLKKKFAHILDGPPVAVDSGLKALQLLQENVFDVILMDIEMPFLSGVDCTQRIRAGRDGVLMINRTARIVAVTTAVGDEPEILYRRTGFDGLIGKPVVYDSMSELLMPLSSAATEALAHDALPRIDIAGESILGPLPPMSTDFGGADRLFFLPSTKSTTPDSPAPEITKSSDFELLLREQIRTSLRQHGAGLMTSMEATSGGGVSDRRWLRSYDEGDCPTPNSTVEVPAPSTSSQQNLVDHAQRARQCAQRQRLERHGSMTISQHALYQQLEREMEAAQVQMPERSPARPALVHRHSDPANVELLGRKVPPLFVSSHDAVDEGCDTGDDTEDIMSPSDDWTHFSTVTADRPTVRLGLPFAFGDAKSRRGSSSSACESSPGQWSSLESSSSEMDDSISPLGELLPRRSNSLATDDGTESDITTPEDDDEDDDGGSTYDGDHAGAMPPSFGKASSALALAKNKAAALVSLPKLRRPSLERHDAMLDIRRHSDGDGSLALRASRLGLA